MPSVGNILRGSRLQAGLTLEQISARTRISVKSLRAIEDDDLAGISSAFFYKSFVRQFAEQIGVQYQDLAEAVNQAATVFPEPLPEGQLVTVLQRSLVKPRKQRVDLRVPVASAALVGALVVCSSLYALWRHDTSLGDASGKVSEVLATAKSWLPGQDADTGKKIAKEVPQGAPPAEQNPAAQPSAPVSSDNGFRVEVSAIEPSWLSVSTDGRQKFAGILKPDQSEVVEGHDTGRMRTGNAGGVKLTFNGRPIGVVGPRGQVRVVVFTKDNYEVIDPNSTASEMPDPIKNARFRIVPVSWTGGPAVGGSLSH